MYDPDIDEMLGGQINPAKNPEMVNGSALGKWLGMARGRVYNLATQGVLPRRADGQFPLQESVVAYCAHIRRGAVGRKADPTLAGEKLRLAREQADKLEIQNEKARGEMLLAADVESEWASIVIDLRAAILAIPERVAAHCSLDRHATAALDTEIRSALEGIANGE